MCESWIRAISKPQPSAKIKRYENNELVTGRKPRDKTRDWSEAKRQDKSHSWSNETRQSPERALKEAREDARHHITLCLCTVSRHPWLHNAYRWALALDKHAEQSRLFTRHDSTMFQARAVVLTVWGGTLSA